MSARGPRAPYKLGAQRHAPALERRGGAREQVRQLADHGQIGETIDIDKPAKAVRRYVSTFFLAGTALVKITGPEACRVVKLEPQE